MPTTPEATEYLQEKGVFFIPGKAANAGGVAVSALEMSQNSERLSWTFEEVDDKFHSIMQDIYQNISSAAEKYAKKDDFVSGANIAGFLKVADAMEAQGTVVLCQESGQFKLRLQTMLRPVRNDSHSKAVQKPLGSYNHSNYVVPCQ